MTQSKHTKAPWKIKPDDNGWPEIYSPAMPDPDCGEIEPIIVKIMPTVDGVSDTFANANLVSAAPELLASLEEIIKCLDEDGSFDKFPDPTSISGRARAAVAKAKGVA